MKFFGTSKELKALVGQLNVPGQWSGRSPYQYRTDRNASLRWWPVTKTIRFQGPSVEREMFRRRVTAAIEAASKLQKPAAAGQDSSSNDVASQTPGKASAGRKSRTIYTIKFEVVGVEKLDEAE